MSILYFGSYLFGGLFEFSYSYDLLGSSIPTTPQYINYLKINYIKY